jgi:hypothetical protein
MSEQMREEFEAWRLGNFCGGVDRLEKRSHAPEVYYYTAEQESWTSWQASRAALVIELPADCQLSRDGLDECHLAGQMRDDIINAIHAAGVKTK